MSSFYEQLSRWYDVLFPEEREITEYLQRDLPPGSTVLDLGCATGIYASALTRRGHTVTGIDLSTAMIDQARLREPGLQFIVGDMTTMPPGPFDLIYCIGNTLPHLPDEAAVRSLMKSIAHRLKPAGQMIIQTVNFDTPLRKLPGINRGGVVMSRAYRGHPDPDRVLFSVRVVTGEREWEQTTPLLALTSQRLRTAVADAGLALAEIVGGYDGSGHTQESFLSIVRTTKP